jgi:hemin uptake protein HemP
MPGRHSRENALARRDGRRGTLLAMVRAEADPTLRAIAMSTTLESDDRHADDANRTPELPGAVPQQIGDRLVFRTEDLFHDRREIWFEHGNDQYRLRITAAGKLILTK